MPLQAKAGFSGLVTTTAETTGAPTGLRIADNVVLRKEGALMPRPVFAEGVFSAGTWPLVRAYLTAYPFRGTMLLLGSGNVLYSDPTSQAAYLPPSEFGGVPTTAVRADVQSAKEARGSLYLAAAMGVLKMAGLGVAFERTGISPTAASFTNAATPAGTLLAAAQKVGYRIVTVGTDVNGVVVRSRPSGMLTVSATGAADVSLTIRYDSLPASFATRAIELYRTRVFPSSAALDDELQLVATFTPAPALSTSLTFLDNVPDINRGLTLYTSPSRGGAENANDPPPGCACLERFRGSLFCGNTVGPHRVTVSYKLGGVVTGSATGIGQRVATGTNTAGATAITSVSSTTGLQVGMLVATQTSGAISDNRITSIAGTTVNVALPLPVAQTTQNVYFFDAVTVTDGSQGGTFQLGMGSSATYGYATTSSALANVPWRVPYTVYEITPPAAGYTQTVVIERNGRGGTPFTIKATHGDEMSPPVPLASSGGAGLASKNDVFPHGLAWSEPDEPEHFPLKNFARVGDAGKAILALVATKDRLLIFKEDGLYMLTGTTARDFGIYPLDTTCLCILPGSVRRLKNTVYLLSNLGIVAVDDSGSVSVVSRPIQLEVATIVNAIRAAHKATGLYNMPGLSGVTGAGDDAQGEYHLALGSSTPSFGGQVLVYSVPRDGYTTFSFGTPAPVALATDGEGNPVVLTASTYLVPSTSPGAVAARVSPRGFSDPAMLGKFWSHVAAAFSQLTGTTNVQARFTSSESQVTTNVTETLEAPTLAGLVQHPLGTLMRHPVPRAVQRAYLLFVELLINVSNGTFTLEAIAAESRENAPNKRPTHGSGAT